MAIAKSMLGRLRGKLGNLSCYEGQDGQTIVRSSSVHRRTSNMEQQRQETEFGTLSKVAAILGYVLKTGFPKGKGVAAGSKGFLQANLKGGAVVAEEVDPGREFVRKENAPRYFRGQVDYAKLQVAAGAVAVPEASVAEIGGGTEDGSRTAKAVRRVRFGWYYQQFLKMEFARSRYAKDYYLIWDSDTIPLNRLSFFTSNKMIFTPKTEYHEPYFRTMQALIGYGKATDYSFIAEHMLVSVPIMKELIRKMETSGIPGDSWFEKVINAAPADEKNGFSEFETYGTYCHYNYPDYFILKELRTFREAGNVYSRSISKRKLRKLSRKYDTISLESWSTPRKSIRKLCNDMEEYIFYPLMKLVSKLR